MFLFLDFQLFFYLFRYVLTTLDQLVAEDYVLVYFHGATPKSCIPRFSWVKNCYQMIDRRLRKNLKRLYLVHPTLWLKAAVLMCRPFIRFLIILLLIYFLISSSNVLWQLNITAQSSVERLFMYPIYRRSLPKFQWIRPASQIAWNSKH